MGGSLGRELQSEVVPRSNRSRAAAVGDDHPLVRAAKAVGSSTFVSPTTSDRTLMPFPSLKMGPGESARSHTADEFVRIDEIDRAITLYEQYIEQLAILYA